MNEYKEEPRICTNCGARMDSGYVIDNGLEYFCNDECLHAWYSEQEYDEMCQADAAYWTEWDVDLNAAPQEDV